MAPVIETSWLWRRSVVLATLAFCGLIVGYIALSGPDDRVRETTVMALSALAGAVIGSYLFGAAWDDRNKRAASLQAVGDAGWPGPPGGAVRPDIPDGER